MQSFYCALRPCIVVQVLSLHEYLQHPNSVVFDTINPSYDRANAPLAAAPGPLPCLHLLYQIVVIDIHGFTAVMIAKLYPGAIGGLNANVGTAAPRTISETINHYVYL